MVPNLQLIVCFHLNRKLTIISHSINRHNVYTTQDRAQMGQILTSAHFLVLVLLLYIANLVDSGLIQPITHIRHHATTNQFRFSTDNLIIGETPSSVPNIDIRNHNNRCPRSPSDDQMDSLSHPNSSSMQNNEFNHSSIRRHKPHFDKPSIGNGNELSNSMEDVDQTDTPLHFKPESDQTTNTDDNDLGIVMNDSEMHTNNHKNVRPNSRYHYVPYSSIAGSGYSPLTSNKLYNKIKPSKYSSLASNVAGYNSSPINLNYIHGFLGKPSSTGGPSTYSSASLNALMGTGSLSSKYIYDQNYGAASMNGLDSHVTTTTNNLCGRQQISAREPRIVGGNTTYEGEFPWAVSIQRHGSHHCGGVIVGRRWILTAAHCVRSQMVTNLVVRTGGHTLSRAPSSSNLGSVSTNSISSSPVSAATQLRSIHQANHNHNHHHHHHHHHHHNHLLERDYLVDQIVMHDDFSRYDNLTASQTKSSANTNNADIALLRLKHDIRWNELAWPVCFPHRESGNFSGHEAVVIGWGKLSEKSEEFSNELQKVKLIIIDNKQCQNWFRQAGREMPIDERIICAGFKNGGKDACHGDSGGPLLSRINGHYVVVGVVSTGIGCARPLLPGLYSRVSSYMSWIEKYVTD